MSEEVKEVIIYGVPIKDIVLLVLGAIIGLVASEITNWRRRREDKKEKAIDIIKEVVKFVQKADDIASDMKSYSNLAFKGKLTGERKKQRLLLIEEKLDNLFPQWAFNEFQLHRLGNQNIMDKFKALMEAHTKYTDVLMPDKFKPGIEKYPEEEYLRLYTQFIKLCVEISAVVTSKRILSAPAKKKRA